MTTIYNDPAEFSEESLKGYVSLHEGRLRAVTGGVIRRGRTEQPKVAVILGGGSGHYPAFAGLVGPGLGAGAVVGNLFTSPSAAQAYSVGRAAEEGAGVIFTYGNYAGDVMNFGLAGKQLSSEGVDARQVIVTDDIASAPKERSADRRGIAGDFFVFKIMGAAAERGWTLDEVVRVGEAANKITFTLGLAFSGCTFPGAEEPHFTVPEGKMGLGLGIHGEPGLEDIPWVPASELADLLVDRLLDERPDGSGNKVAVLLNGLGSTKYEELFLLWGLVAERLEQHGLDAIAPEVGELVTSLDMGGVSLTFAWLDDELEDLWLAPASTPAWSRGQLESSLGSDWVGADEEGEADEPVTGTAESRAAAENLVRSLSTVETIIRDQEVALGRVDAVAADGDHGRGMTRGTHAAAVAATSAAGLGWGARGVLERAADAWAAEAGGTSGVLWGAGLRALAAQLSNDTAVSPESVVQGARAFVSAVQELGGAAVGDKTFIDAADPFATTLHESFEQSGQLGTAWGEAAAAAVESATATAALEPKKGRARPLAQRSVGHPDPGALSFALIVEAVGRELFSHETNSSLKALEEAVDGIGGE